MLTSLVIRRRRFSTYGSSGTTGRAGASRGGAFPAGDAKAGSPLPACAVRDSRDPQAGTAITERVTIDVATSQLGMREGYTLWQIAAMRLISVVGLVASF